MRSLPSFRAKVVNVRVPGSGSSAGVGSKKLLKFVTRCCRVTATCSYLIIYTVGTRLGPLGTGHVFYIFLLRFFVLVYCTVRVLQYHKPWYLVPGIIYAFPRNDASSSEPKQASAAACPERNNRDTDPPSALEQHQLPNHEQRQHYCRCYCPCVAV